MIFLYSGTPGSGKSLHVASVVYHAKFGGYACIGNIPIDTPKKYNYTFVDNSELTPEVLYKFSENYFKTHKFGEGKINVIIDEAQLIFNARDWGQKSRASWLSFFTQHRKLGYNVYLVAQFDRMLDRQIRSLIEYEYIHRKVSNYGWRGKLLSIWFLNRLFVCVKVWYPMKEKVGAEYFLLHKKYYKLYDTYQTWTAPVDG